ncbi:hypothetical protein swp_1565 [Shewanella piezotolerans WP3]|uniref:Uncharacterized protein n=1 Tax=Shewanella piezotolerans (strain WP3 / JCM 13877) TaxID=225849 RepID=B8CL22_SHEPW|nr:hypothetical protein [Shewanella piezotolerans]ACJ28348.1 hypothetical protein swp_1565 [Shewanella piezotolerans WP3]
MKVFKKIVVTLNLKICRFIYRAFLILRKNKKSILIYTDSRGTEIDSPFKQRNPFYSYLQSFNEYDVDYKFCPYKFTSILDFISYYENSNKKYDVIVLHCGIVDFAPRPVSSYNQMLSLKRDFLKSKGWEDYFENRNDFLNDYLGEKTLQFMSTGFIEKEILPILKEVDNLIYVGINPVLIDWDGDYWRKRPSSINQQLVQDKLVLQSLDNTIDLSGWNEDEIKKYTVDNVHYNKDGLNKIGRNVLSNI